MNDAIIYGKTQATNIVSIEPHDGYSEIFYEDESGVESDFVEGSRYWLLAPAKLDKQFEKLDGGQYYRWLREFVSFADYRDFIKKHKKKWDLFYVSNPKEALMVYYGLNYYQGMTFGEPSILSFDLETTTLEHNEDAKILLIANTYRSSSGEIKRALFSFDEYDSEGEMLEAWSEWVRKHDPSLVIGHNILGFDIPYMKFCADRANISLNIGRDGSSLKLDNYQSRFRKDSQQFLYFNKPHIYGREVVDTLFASLRYDIARKFENYKLKYLMKATGLEKEDRQHYDASQIRENYKNPQEWSKIKQYAIEDGDDALALFDLMTPPYFYLTQSVPKPFQDIMTKATGSQINSLLIRSYIQQGHSIPKPTQATDYEGALSYGVPGIYKNVVKWDIASLYPSIILQYRVHDKNKDPKAHLLHMVEYFTNDRLNNKKLAKETGESYYKNVEQSQKVVINSVYGMMGAQGLNFNSPPNAAFVTRKGRELLQKAIKWATGYSYDEWKKAYG